MVVSKPVARWTIWLGKWFGVNLVNMLLLLIATLAIYAIVMYRFNNEEFSAGDKERIRNEVLVGRRVFMPDQPDFEQEVRERVKEKVRRLQEQGKGVDMTPENQDRLIESAKAEVGANASEVPFGYSAIFPVRLTVRFTCVTGPMSAKFPVKISATPGSGGRSGCRR